MKLNRIKALLLCLAILTNIIVGYTMPITNVFAYEAKPAYVHSDVRVNVRKGAGTVYPILKSAQGENVKLYDGHEVTIIGEKEASDGSLWYNVQFKYTDGSTLTGYIHSYYIVIAEINYKPDADFEAYLKKQGFPESYRNDLRKLHEKYPNWVFVADKVNIDWSTAVANQSKLGRNLISINAISSWKSIADGSFDWLKNEWATFNGGVWAGASKELIEYCMDPRNFLDEQYIFQFELLQDANYVKIGQDTLYYKKFDYVGTPYTNQYTTHILAPSNEALIVSKAYTEEFKNASAIVFKIPVFKNMPENKVMCPESDGNPNAYLSKLEVTGCEMTPSFAYDVQEYTVVVPYDIDTVDIITSTIDKKAKVTGDGKLEIVTGANNVNVKVVAENGLENEYKITIIREETPKELIKEIEITSSKYTIDNDNLIISGILADTTVKNFLKGFKANKDGKFVVINDNGDIFDGVVGTGLTLRFTDTEGATKDYKILVVGDVNGDGQIGIVDAIALQKHILGKDMLEGLYAKAGDVNGKKDGITIIDAIMLQEIVLGKNR